jgi:two-component system, NtrC family, sensor histidine kinase HydH
VTQGRILLVDDNIDLVDNLGEILEDEGYKILRATSCATARARAAEGFDVALVDLRLPDGDGTELAAELRQTVPGAEVVLLTGFASVESAAAAIRAGACAYLVKPCAVPELLLTVGQALRQVRLQAEREGLARRAQLAEKLAAVGRLTAGLSHEIRNPLNAAALQLSVLERRVRKLPGDGQATLLEPLVLVQDEIRRLDQTLQDFLLFSRPRELIRKPVQTEALLRKVADLMSGDAEGRLVHLLVDVAPGTPAAAADEGVLRQVLLNLILNALDVSPRGGRIRLLGSGAEDGVELVVADEGPGVPPEVQDRLFEPFFTTKPSGLGMGLAICRSIVEAHGGHIRPVDPRGPGTCLQVSLPVHRS